MSARRPASARVVYVPLLGAWYVVRGPHHTPISGRFETQADARAWLAGRRNGGSR